LAGKSSRAKRRAECHPAWSGNIQVIVTENYQEQGAERNVTQRGQETSQKIIKSKEQSRISLNIIRKHSGNSYGKSSRARRRAECHPALSGNIQVIVTENHQEQGAERNVTHCSQETFR
jgi:ribosomal protein L31